VALNVTLEMNVSRGENECLDLESVNVISVVK